MRKAIHISSALVVAVAGTAAVTAVLLRVDLVLATPGLQTAFVSQYPHLRETQANSCVTCHMPVVKDALNDYGLDLREAKINFREVEELDSDQDGRTNIEEIEDASFPGSQAAYPEYYVFHVKFSETDPELGKVHFNHEMHTIKESFLSAGRCDNCHGKDLFPMRFDDNVPVRHLGHQVCWRCHETSGSRLAPKNCTGCHVGIDEYAEEFKGLLENQDSSGNRVEPTRP